MYNIEYIRLPSKLNEGIDINYNTHTVSFNPNHENNVDTSLEHNPIIDNTIMPNVEVYSIFTRKRNKVGDGNPLIYAFKGEDDWKFNSKEDRMYLEWRIQEIVSKFLLYHHSNVVIIIPSTNVLNSYIANIIKNNLKPIDWKL